MENAIAQLIREWTLYAMTNGGATLSFTRAMLHCANQLSDAVKETA